MTIRYVYWQEGHFWLGYLEEFPDYWTQGESLEDLQDHLKDLYNDLACGVIPNVRRIAKLERLDETPSFACHSEGRWSSARGTCTCSRVLWCQR